MVCKQRRMSRIAKRRRDSLLNPLLRTTDGRSKSQSCLRGCSARWGRRLGLDCGYFDVREPMLHIRHEDLQIFRALL